jgi:DNA repair protein RecO (recombination protein O)
MAPEWWWTMNQSMRERNYRTNAIVLQCRDLGEADRIFVVFTPERGKLSVIAKGVRKASSRSGPYLDYFAEVHLELARGRDLDVVTGASAINPHLNLRVDIDAYGHAAYLAELVRDLTQEQQENRQIYTLLSASLALLNDGIDPWHVARHFELGMLVATGYQPDLLECANCQRALEAIPNVFSPQMGGVLCPDCAQHDRAGTTLSVNAQKYVRTLARTGLAGVIKLEPDENVRHQVSQALLAYLRQASDRDFASLRVLGTMNRAPGIRS